MKRTSKVLSVFLAVLMMFSIIPMANIEAEAASIVKSKLDSFISNYPSGSRWTGSFDGGIQCYGFGKMVIYNIFGKASNGAYRTWTYSASSTTGMSVIGSITNFSSSNVKSLLSNAKCGDVLQFNTTNQHTMIVYSVDNNGVTIYDCNWDNNCGISKRYCTFGTWSGRNSSKLTLLRADNYNVIEQHTHSYTEYYEATHPHKIYKKCSCGEWYYTGATKTLSSCSTCTHTHSYSTYYEAAHPHKIYKKCSCGDWYYTGEYKTVSSCSSCQPPSGYHMWFDGGTKYYLYDTITVNAESNNAKQYQFVFTLPSGKDNYTDWMTDGKFSATSIETGTYKVSYLAKNDYGTYDARNDGCTLTFYYVAPTISISNSTSVSLKVGNTHQIYLTADTGDNDTDISFSSSNTNVATVSSSGLITAKSSGTSTITAKLVYHGDNGDYTTSCKMTVSVSEKIYTVKFNANGGSGTMSNQSFTYDTAKALTANSFTRTGYTFLGWSTSSTATTATYTDKQSVKNLTSTDGGTVTLYAVWKPNTYTVNFNANGGTGTMSNQSFTYDTAKALTANSFTRTGYTFLGWSTSSSATTATYTDKQSVKNLTTTNGGYVTLYAVWQKDAVTVSSISIATKPTKTEYYVGDTFSSNGLTIKAVMSDGTIKTLTSGFTVSKPNMSTAGTKTVTVTCGGKTTTFTIKVVEKPVTPETPDTDFTFYIQEPSRIEIRNKDGIILHTVVEGKLPDGARIEWSWDNNKFDVEKNDDGTLTIIARNNGETTITATVYGADGDILATDSIVMNSKSGFFDKIGGFFRSLFGATTIYEN